MTHRFALLAALALSTPALACAPLAHADVAHTGGPVELGRVAWETDFEAALDRAEAETKPVFALFQEVPGCATCKDFGGGPLSHPLLVEAIESEFVPVLVYNNRGGKDAELLERFGEPSWNNPVVRFLDATGEDLLPRRAGVWSTGAIAARMVAALEEAEREVPTYLALAELETRERGLETATFAMDCFWVGEARLGSLPGVAATRPGWLDGREVVEVRFDPNALAYGELVRAADALQCSRRVFAHDDDQERVARELAPTKTKRVTTLARDAKKSDRARNLARSPLRFLPLTPLQATRVNSALAHGENAGRWLSPRQRTLAARMARADRDQLAGLQRPDDLEQLPAYAAVVAARFAETPEPDAAR